MQNADCDMAVAVSIAVSNANAAAIVTMVLYAARALHRRQTSTHANRYHAQSAYLL
jgi:hypothetical protein